MATDTDWEALSKAWRECYPESPVPNREEVEASIAEEDGRVVGFLFAQSIVHVGQFGIAPSHRGNKVHFSQLLETIEPVVQEIAPGFITFATTDRDPQMVHAGYSLPHWYVYRKFF